MKLLGSGALFAALLRAQTYEIRGTVTEPGVGGIPGVALQVSRHPQTDPSGRLRTLPEALPIQAAT